MKILGIETSCDETALCIIETVEQEQAVTLTVLGNQLYSQIAKHKEWGGVMPTLAKREHQKNLVPLFEKCLNEAKMNLKNSQAPAPEKIEKVQKILERESDLLTDFLKTIPPMAKPDIDAIAVTNGPGLEPALWVGVNFAKALSALWDIPIIPTNHMEGHILVSNLIADLDKNVSTKISQYLISETKYPAIALLISGGHTQLVLVNKHLKYEIIGSTRDDAVGEAYDKVARMLNLPYPGGPEISKLASEFKAKSAVSNQKTTPNFKFPRPMIHSKDFDFSFSGLKTSVLYMLKTIPNITKEIKQEIAFEFQNAIIDTLVSKAKRALEQNQAKTLIVGGGVIANTEIRGALKKLADEMGVGFKLPEITASTDNALMIAVAGFANLKNGKKTTSEFKAEGNLSL